MSAVVYFVRTDPDGPTPDLIKIGFTTDLERRLPQLRTWFGSNCEVMATINGEPKDERAIHRAFKDERHGRWELFEPSPSLLAYIENKAAA